MTARLLVSFVLKTVLFVITVEPIVKVTVITRLGIAVNSDPNLSLIITWKLLKTQV
jgi:hypothetical protein